MTHYDVLARRYDSLYSGPRHKSEDRDLFESLAPHLLGSVLDVGCGTGIMLDYVSTMTLYLGIDPSTGMIGRLLEKHPDAHVLPVAFEDYFVDPPVDLVVALFGTASYISPSAYPRLKEAGRDHFLMFYRPGYWPEYDPEDVLRTDYAAIDSSFSEVYDWHDFRVATSLPVRLT